MSVITHWCALYAEMAVHKQAPVPLPAPFANTGRFWKDIVVFGLIGCFMGLFGFIFVSCFSRSTAFFWNDLKKTSHPDHEAKWELHSGEWYLPLVGACAGLAVGVLRVVLSYPDKGVPSFYDEANR